MVNAVTYKADDVRENVHAHVSRREERRWQRNRKKEYSKRMSRGVKKTETVGTPENRRNKIFAADKMVHGSRGVEIKRRYCFFRQANANGKIVARTRKR